MSLNKQRILSELGNVMNQLQSADCGCMGKLFSNSNQGQGAQPTMGNPLPTCGGCRRGCCQGHGYSHGHGNVMPNSGDHYQVNSTMNMNQHCMGHCNPPKLYTDTYNYLNNNLMQPVVQEVYNDLKDITPQNTIMNSPMADQMGLSGNTGNADMAQKTDTNGGRDMNQMQNMLENINARNLGNLMPNVSGAGNMNSMQQRVQNPINNMSGMGPEIAKMILGESGKKKISPRNMIGSGEQMSGNVLSDSPQSPHSQIGVIPPNQGQNQGINAYSMNQSQNSSMQCTNRPVSAANTQNILMHRSTLQNPGNPQIGLANSPVPQMTAPNQHQYGQHSQGVKKFKEMFPGVMQGDLGFDPMAIAIQMNPENQQKAAINTMQKIMNGSPMNTSGNISAQPAAAPANVAQSIPMTQYQQYTNQQILPGSGEQQIDSTITSALPIQLNAVQPQQQQVHAAVTGNQQLTYQLPLELQPQQNQSMLNPDTGAAVVSSTQGIPNAQMQQPVPSQLENPAMQQIIKEPIFPADNTRNQPLNYTKLGKCYEYNTLGQPIQMMPAQLFHPTDPGLPQTLSPQPVTTKLRNDPMKYSNVKSTVSKTSIMGNKQLGKGSSKSQLQHIYNQYKGSQSYTQQNLPAVHAPTHSEGKLNVTQPNAVANLHRQVLMEKVGGDTVANNQQITDKVEEVTGQVGDVPAINKPYGDMEALKTTAGIPDRQAKLRNGLQDVVYTSYPSSAAWSFHGANNHRPMSMGYRYRELK